jgi:hypothetical protein
MASRARLSGSTASASPPLQLGGRQRRVCGRTPTAEQRGGGASPVARGYRAVACLIVTAARLNLCIISANLNNVADDDRGAARDVRAIDQNPRDKAGRDGAIGGAARVASYVPTVSSRNGEPSSFAVSPRAWSAKRAGPAYPWTRSSTSSPNVSGPTASSTCCSVGDV